MSWIEKLYQTYENCRAKIGDPNEKTPLLPICHTTMNVQVEIVLDEKGNFRRASVIPKDQASTIIPATEESAGRTSGPVPHPLCDKLQYVAGDYVAFGGRKEALFRAYLEQLNTWCASPFAHPKVRAVRDYVQQEHLISDLVHAKILHVDETGKLLPAWKGEKQDRPEIFAVLQGDQSDVVVRFAVGIPDDPQSKLWQDTSVWQSWIGYYMQKAGEKGLCYVTGTESVLAKNHPAKIRNSGDKAKLISSNDTSGFTFRGRFLADHEACEIGFEVSQKAHNALRWLISRQGWRNGDLAFVAWAISSIDIPDPLADTWDLCYADAAENQNEVDAKTIDTAQDLGKNLSKLLSGYTAKLGKTDNVVVMGLNSATPGRMAIIYYRELTGSDFLARVQMWHAQCRWLQHFSKEKIFIGAPAPKDIAKAAFGNEVDAKLLNATVERLIPCIIDGMAIPRDLLDSTVRRACKRQSVDAWEWEKILGIACALYKYAYHEKEDYTMPLDHTRTSRDYLYGRLLAVADCLEGFALSDAEKGRPTNAARLMQRFADRPYSTWRTIELALAPYKARLGYKAKKYDVMLEEVMGLFETEDFIKDTPLSGEFLLGFHKQRTELYQSSATENTDEEHQQ